MRSKIFYMELTAAQLAEMVNGVVEGDASIRVSSYSKIEEATPGSLTFLANAKYEHFIYTTGASIVLVKKDFLPEHPISATLIRVDNPYETIAKLLNIAAQYMAPERVGIETPSYVSEGVELPDDVYVGAFAYIGRNVKIGKSVKIYPQCYVGDNVVLDDGVTLYPGVTVYHDCVVGKRCTIHSGTVVGADGFGFAPNEKGEYTKIAQIGNVVIEDDVEIGANTTIDRATMGSTRIRRGVKLDNLIQVAHNVEVGEHTVIAAQTGIAGSAKIGSHNMIGGQVGFAGHITIGDYNQIGAQSGIHSNPGNGKVLLGYPAVDARQFMKQSAYIKNLGDLYNTVRELKKEIIALKENK